MTEWGLRVRTIASDHYVVLVAAAVLVAVAGGWLVYATHLDPDVEQTQAVQGTWESAAGYDHRATVTEQNRVFEEGTTLEGRSTYYTRLMPELDATFRYRFDAASGELDVETVSRLVIRSVGEDDEVLWDVEEPLASNGTTLSPGETQTVEFTVNVSEVAAEVDSIESELGTSAGETEVFVHTDVTAEGTASGGPVDRSTAYDLAFTTGSDTYSVAADDGRQQHQHAETVTRDADPGLARAAAGPTLVLLGLLGLAGLGGARYRGYVPVSERERTAAALTEARREFDDWISRGSVPSSATDRPTVDIDSLEDLVDVAVDTESRVIEDADADCYYVLTAGNCYRYEPPGDLPA